MERSRLLDCLAADYSRLRDVAARDLAAPVPTCPGWSVRDLVLHVAEVYLHKTEAIRLREWPDPWPPDLSGEEPIAALDRAYEALTGQFAGAASSDPAKTWFDPDQTVGFWVRRMAQETVIHRVDGEVAAGEPLAPIPDDLALDGVDELLMIFFDYGVRRWPDEFEPALATVTGHTVGLRTDGGRWLVTARRTGVEVAPDVDGHADAEVTASPVALLLWLWGRSDTGVEITGSREAVDELRRLLVAATQ
jgi:uncharacterized protein (TIGR03083 family)